MANLIKRGLAKLTVVSSGKKDTAAKGNVYEKSGTANVGRKRP